MIKYYHKNLKIAQTHVKIRENVKKSYKKYNYIKNSLHNF